MCSMYIMECTGPNQGRQEETQHTTHKFRRLFLGLLLMGWRGCASAMGVIKTYILLFRKPLCNQFIHYHISSRGVVGINHFKLRNFAVVAIECSFAYMWISIAFCIHMPTFHKRDAHICTRLHGMRTHANTLASHAMCACNVNLCLPCNVHTSNQTVGRGDYIISFYKLKLNMMDSVSMAFAHCSMESIMHGSTKQGTSIHRLCAKAWVC